MLRKCHTEWPFRVCGSDLSKNISTMVIIIAWYGMLVWTGINKNKIHILHILLNIYLCMYTFVLLLKVLFNMKQSYIQLVISCVIYTRNCFTIFHHPFISDPFPYPLTCALRVSGSLSWLSLGEGWITSWTRCHFITWFHYIPILFLHFKGNWVTFITVPFPISEVEECGNKGEKKPDLDIGNISW